MTIVPYLFQGIFALMAVGLISGCSSLLIARSNTLSAVSNPASPYHTDYLDYRQGHLTKAQLMDRLPHVAMIGDSLSRDFYVSSPLSMLWRSKMNHRRDWFLDTDASPGSVYSLYERLARETPLVACEYSSCGGEVDSGGGGNGLFSAWRPIDLSGQTDMVLKEERFPDLVLLWIGHNNLDWVASVGAGPHEDTDVMCRKMAADFRKEYARQLDRLVERARAQKTRRAIVVFGLFDLARYFDARDRAGRRREADPKLYPSFEIDYQRFESMKPEYRATMVRLSVMCNAELRAMVEEFNRTLDGDSKVRLEYSDALATLDDDSGVEWLHPMDAWHLSPHGHTRVAEAVFPALHPSLDFLGIGRPREQADSRREPSDKRSSRPVNSEVP